MCSFRVPLLAILAILTSHLLIFTTSFYDFLGSRAVSGHRMGGLASRLSQRCTLSLRRRLVYTPPPLNLFAIGLLYLCRTVGLYYPLQF